MIVITKPQKRTIFVDAYHKFHLFLPPFIFELKEFATPDKNIIRFNLFASTTTTTPRYPLPLPNVNPVYGEVCLATSFYKFGNILYVDGYERNFTTQEILNFSIQRFWLSQFNTFKNPRWISFLSSWQDKQYDNWHDIYKQFLEYEVN